MVSIYYFVQQVIVAVYFYILIRVELPPILTTTPISCLHWSRFCLSFPQGMQLKMKIVFLVFLAFVFQKHNPLEKGIYVHEQNVLLDGTRKVESPSDKDKMHLTHDEGESMGGIRGKKRFFEFLEQK